MGDLLFEFTEWLRTTPLVELSLAISETGLNRLIVENFWVIPILQFIHILSIAAAFGAVLMVSLRVNGWAGAGMTLAETSRRYIPWMWWGLAMLAATGLLLIVGEPVRELINPIFWIKMVLVVLTVLFSIAYTRKLASQTEVGGAVASGFRAGSFLLIAAWCVIILCGRWIAYAPV